MCCPFLYLLFLISFIQITKCYLCTSSVHAAKKKKEKKNYQLYIKTWLYPVTCCLYRTVCMWFTLVILLHALHHPVTPHLLLTLFSSIIFTSSHFPHNSVHNPLCKTLLYALFLINWLPSLYVSVIFDSDNCENCYKKHSLIYVIWNILFHWCWVWGKSGNLSVLDSSLLPFLFWRLMVLSPNPKHYLHLASKILYTLTQYFVYIHHCSFHNVYYFVSLVLSYMLPGFPISAFHVYYLLFFIPTEIS